MEADDPGFWNLELAASLELGAWCLELLDRPIPRHLSRASRHFSSTLELGISHLEF